MSEHEQQPEEREETIEDLEVPDDEGDDVQGGRAGWDIAENKGG